MFKVVGTPDTGINSFRDGLASHIYSEPQLDAGINLATSGGATSFITERICVAYRNVLITKGTAESWPLPSDLRTPRTPYSGCTQV